MDCFSCLKKRKRRKRREVSYLLLIVEIPKMTFKLFSDFFLGGGGGGGIIGKIIVGLYKKLKRKVKWIISF